LREEEGEIKKGIAGADRELTGSKGIKHWQYRVYFIKNEANCRL
jgi:hypothetical protein